MIEQPPVPPWIGCLPLDQFRLRPDAGILSRIVHCLRVDRSLDGRAPWRPARLSSVPRIWPCAIPVASSSGPQPSIWSCRTSGRQSDFDDEPCGEISIPE